MVALASSPLRPANRGLRRRCPFQFVVALASSPLRPANGRSDRRCPFQFTVALASSPLQPANGDFHRRCPLHGGTDGAVAWVAPLVTNGHRIEIRDGDALVEVRVRGDTVARTSRVKVLHETGLPPRYYIPRDDVLAALTPTDTSTTCPFKGDASYWSVGSDGDAVVDIAWSYEDPITRAEAIRGHVAFFDEHVDVLVDGALQERPTTPWS